MEIRPGTGGKYRLRDYAPLAGWNTPTNSDGKTDNYGHRMSNGEYWLKVSGQAKLAGWRSPTVNDSLGSDYYANGELKCGGQAKLAGWPTTRATDFKTGISPMNEGGGVRGDLVSVTQLSGWPTPLTGSATFEGARDKEHHRLLLPGAAILSGWHEGNAEGEDIYTAHVDHGGSPIYARIVEPKRGDEDA